MPAAAAAEEEILLRIVIDGKCRVVCVVCAVSTRLYIILSRDVQLRLLRRALAGL